MKSASLRRTAPSEQSAGYGIRPHWRGRFPLVVAAAMITGCGPDGSGSIHVDQVKAGKFIVVPDRKASMPEPTKGRSGRPPARSNVRRS